MRWSPSRFLIALFTVAAAMVVALGSSADRAAAQQPQPTVTCVEEFGLTGGTQTFAVPAGVTELRIDAYGAEGGDVSLLPGVKALGGRGAAALGTTVAVTPGDQVEILVGGAGGDGDQATAGGAAGAGGFNGGAAGGDADYHYGGGGGGASSVLLNGTALVIAGGGGGAGHGSPNGPPNGSGGHGGLNGTAGTGSAGAGLGQPGQGGTTVAGGAGGAGQASVPPGGAGQPGTAGQGGLGGDSAAGTSTGDGGGGGGGGAFGGGGGGGSNGAGAGAGAGGGSSMGQPDTTFQTGVKEGDGFVRVSYQAEHCGPPDTCIEEFGSTGDDQTWEVPLGVDEVRVDAYGAQGGTMTNLGAGYADGGLGGAALGTTLAVTAGDQVEMVVGGEGADVTGAGPGSAGGFGGGGDGGSADTHTGAGGGGASTVALNGTTMVIAGGGGGAAHGSNPGSADPTGGYGGAGGLNGTNGVGSTEDGNINGYGLGATTSAGGAGGPNSGAGSTAGSAGTAGQGGTGGVAHSANGGDAGGGGGGGAFGGGGGGGGVLGSTASGSGGGGGSSIGQPDTEFETGVKDGDGLVRLTYTQKGCGVADLAIVKTGPATVAPGGQITWTMTVTNNGPEPSTGSTVTDQIPAAVTNAATSTAGCSIADATLSCAVGALDVDASTEIVVTATAPATGSTCVTNGATVTGEQFDPVEVNNTATATTCTTPLPPPEPGRSNVTVDKTAADSSVTVGDTVTYTVVARNEGPGVATNVNVSDRVPSQLDAESAITTQGTCTLTGNQVSCALGILTVGQTVTVTVEAIAIRAGDTTNTASVTSNECMTTPCDTDPAEVRIRKPRLGLTKGVNKKRLSAGEKAVYTIRVRNPSKRALRNVRTCDNLPSGLVFVKATSKAKLSGGKFCWTAKTLGAGKSKTYKLTVRALAGTSGKKVNRATATSADARSKRAKRTVRVRGGQVRAGGVTG